MINKNKTTLKDTEGNLLLQTETSHSLVLLSKAFAQKLVEEQGFESLSGKNSFRYDVNINPENPPAIVYESIPEGFDIDSICGILSVLTDEIFAHINFDNSHKCLVVLEIEHSEVYANMISLHLYCKSTNLKFVGKDNATHVPIPFTDSIFDNAEVYDDEYDEDDFSSDGDNHYENDNEYLDQDDEDMDNDTGGSEDSAEAGQYTDHCSEYGEDEDVLVRQNKALRIRKKVVKEKSLIDKFFGDEDEDDED